MIGFLKTHKELLLFHLTVNVIIGLFITFGSYIHIPVQSLDGILAYAAHFLIVQFSIFCFTYILSLNKYVFYIVFTFLFLICSFAGYWAYTQDLAFTQGVIQAILEAKSQVIYELFNFYLLIYYVFTIVALIFILIWYKRLKFKIFNIIFLIFSLIGIFAFFVIDYIKLDTLSSRLPYSLIKSVYHYQKKPPMNFIKIDQPLITTNKGVNVIFILGESVRADHLGINGYYRNTTPHLSKTPNLYSFGNVHTERTYTDISVPQILSNESMDEPNIKMRTSLIDVLNMSDIHTVWIGNQVEEPSFSYFINGTNKHIYIDPLHSVYSFHNSYDIDILPHFRTEIKPDEQKFMILHMLGSHWMYDKRYSDKFKKYKPTAKSKFLPDNTQDEMINAYDNTILFLDYFINQVIKEAEKYQRETVVIYLSDHGELLGEGGRYLHAQSSKYLKNPACLVWFSKPFVKAHPNIVNHVQKVQKVQNNKINSDFLYPSVLSLFDIKGISYDESKSIFLP